MIRLLELADYLSSVIKWEIAPNGFYEDLGVLFIGEYKVKNKIIAPNVLRKTEAQLKEESNLYLMELIGKESSLLKNNEQRLMKITAKKF